MTVLGEEILMGACGTDEKAMQATWHVTATTQVLSKSRQ